MGCYNRRCLAELNVPVRRFPGRHTGAKAKDVPADHADGLYADCTVAIGARVMLTTNLWIYRGLVNGAMGTVTDIGWLEGADPSVPDLPHVAMVKFDDYDGPTWETGDPTVQGPVPILLITKEYEWKGANCARTNLPLRLAWAITVHKSQGLTMNGATTEISDKENSAGLRYVAMSRVKKLEILFESG